MTEERKKRFYPKRDVAVVDPEIIAYKPVSVGRPKKDDSEAVAEAIKGIDGDVAPKFYPFLSSFPAFNLP